VAADGNPLRFFSNGYSVTVPTKHEDFTDRAFLDRLRAGEEAAVQRLVHTYLPQLIRTARGAGLGLQDAEDAAQNTFVTCVEKAAGFEGRSHIRTWLFGILYRKIAEQRRTVHRGDSHEDIDEIMESRFRSDGFWANPPQGTDTDAYHEEVRRHLEDCLDGVTTDQRLAFVLREVEGLESGEICEALDVSRSNLGVLLFRGRNKLRECLESRDVEGR